MDGIAESGRPKDFSDYGAARRRLVGAASEEKEAALKAARNCGGSLDAPSTNLPSDLSHQHFGHVVVSCEKADLRPTAKGIAIHADQRQDFELLASPSIPRIEVIDGLYGAVLQDRVLVHSGEWACATTKICLAILESARTQALPSLHRAFGTSSRYPRALGRMRVQPFPSFQSLTGTLAILTARSYFFRLRWMFSAYSAGVVYLRM
jgi:phthalate 4,5-cis-dihydrodiol dehydrogenase